MTPSPCSLSHSRTVRALSHSAGFSAQLKPRTEPRPLFVFNQFGDLERCALRPGNVHSADGWKDVLDPVVQRYRGKVTRIYFRADAAFAMPDRGTVPERTLHPCSP